MSLFPLATSLVSFVMCAPNRIKFPTDRSLVPVNHVLSHHPKQIAATTDSPKWFFPLLLFARKRCWVRTTFSLSYVVINVLYTSSSCNIIICKFENTKEKRSTHTVHKMSSLRCLPEDSMPIIFLLDTAEFGSHREMWKSLLTTIVINFRWHISLWNLLMIPAVSLQQPPHSGVSPLV